MSTAAESDKKISIRLLSSDAVTAGKKKAGKSPIARGPVARIAYFEQYMKDDDDPEEITTKELFERAIKVNGAAAIVELMKHEVPDVVIASYCGLNLSNKSDSADWNAMKAKIRQYYKNVLAEEYVNSRIEESYEVPVMTQHGEVNGTFTPRKACLEWLFRETSDPCKVKLNRIDNSAVFQPWELGGSERDWQASRSHFISEYRKVFRTREAGGSSTSSVAVGQSIAKTILGKIGG